MSCNYAEGLSSYADKGVLGLPEKFESPESVDVKIKTLAEWMLQSRHVVIHTGAGISTTAGIPDFRGPNGVWTLEEKGLKPTINLSFEDAVPTPTHMALKHLVDKNYVRCIISQNIDGLHLRTGVPRRCLLELHGNMFIEQCDACERQFVRNQVTTSVGQKSLGTPCKRSGRACRGKLHDTILDWEHNLPENDLMMAKYHSSVADLSVCLGTTLQIVPSGNLPLNTKKFGGRIVIINLQPTKQDKKADLIINTYVDDALVKLLNHMDLKVPQYSKEEDPTKGSDLIEWTVKKEFLNDIQKLYDLYCRSIKRNKMKQKKENKCKAL